MLLLLATAGCGSSRIIVPKRIPILTANGPQTRRSSRWNNVEKKAKERQRPVIYLSVYLSGVSILNGSSSNKTYNGWRIAYDMTLIKRQAVKRIQTATLLFFALADVFEWMVCVDIHVDHIRARPPKALLYGLTIFVGYSQEDVTHAHTEHSNVKSLLSHTSSHFSTADTREKEWLLLRSCVKRPIPKLDRQLWLRDTAQSTW